jgi:molecular chaperone Hsp33
MAIGVLIGKGDICIGAGGIIIQTMPSCSEENIIKAEKLISSFTEISRIISEKGAEGVINEYFPNENFTESNPVYACNCSQEYIDKVLITLGNKELYQTVEEEGKVEICCHFCDKKYVYYKNDIDRLFDNNYE